MKARLLAAGTLTLAALALTACAGEVPAETPSGQTNSEAVSMAPSPPAPSAPAKADPAIEKLARKGFQPSKRVLENRYGKYTQLELATDSELKRTDKNHEGGLPTGWTQADGNKAAEFAATFILQEIIDSPVNGDPAMIDEWTTQNKKTFASAYWPDMRRSATSDNSFVMREAWQDDMPEYSKPDYRYPQQAGRVRFSDFDMRVQDSYTSDRIYVVTYDVSYTMPGISDTGAYEQNTTIDATLALTKAGKAFQITGINVDYDTRMPIAISG